MGLAFVAPTQENLAFLRQCSRPGNLRELASVIDANGAAAVLEIHPHTLRARMRTPGVEWSKFRFAGAEGWVREQPAKYNPVDDARGNADALLQIKDEYGLRIGLEGATIRSRITVLVGVAHDPRPTTHGPSCGEMAATVRSSRMTPCCTSKTPTSPRARTGRRSERRQILACRKTHRDRLAFANHCERLDPGFKVAFGRGSTGSSYQSALYR